MTETAIYRTLSDAFPSLAVEEPPGPAGLLVPAELHLAFATFLKEQLGFTLYVTVAAWHLPADEAARPSGTGTAELAGEGLMIATVLRRPTRPSATISWRVAIPVEGSIPSLFQLFAGADWQEREQYDLVGVTFSQHPDPRRLMLPEDWEGYPLRREYAIDTAHAPWR